MVEFCVRVNFPLSRYCGGLEGPFGPCWGPLAPSSVAASKSTLIMYGFCSSKCLWKRLDEMLQSIFYEKKISKFFYPQKDPLKFFGVQNISHGNGSSAFVFQVTGILKPVTDSTDKILQLSHSHMAGCNSLYGSNFDFRMTYFDARHFRRKLRHFGCKLLNKSQ